MRILLQTIFSEFKDKILDSSYYPTNPLTLLKTRLTAISLLQAENPDLVKQAKAFILKTSSSDQDFAHLEQFSLQALDWNELELCSTYTNILGHFLEYKLSFMAKDRINQTLHFHARYEMKKQLCYFVSQTAPLIRVIGDPILQKPGILFPEHATKEQKQELFQQIEHAKSVLIQTGGAGIAANQCAEIDKPYCFTIVGVFHDIPEHAMGVERRYPGAKFPQAVIMVNPQITSLSTETQEFNHACLSVPCANRCTVASPMAMTVFYLDPLDSMCAKELTFDGVNAVVLWHELTHIIHGKTYMDVTFESLAGSDLFEFRKLSHHEILRRQAQSYAEIPELTVPPFHLSVRVDNSGVLRVDFTELTKVLPKITTETLLGLLNQANLVLKKKQLMNSSQQKLSIFRTDVERQSFSDENQLDGMVAKL